MGKFTNKEYAEYMLANYVLGSRDTALFIAMSLFEKYFHEQLEKRKHPEYIKIKNDPKLKNDLKLVELIKWYCQDSNKEDPLFSWEGDLRPKLDNFRYFRNDFTHGFDDSQMFAREKEIETFILYVYFAHHPAEKYDESITKRSNKDYLLLQDYKVKELTERMMERLERSKYQEDSMYVKTFTGFEEADFENLFELRKKMVFLSRTLEKSFKSFSIKRTIISPIDTTSAYIWMPFIIENAPQEPNDYETERKNLIESSLSILATPMDFRIYLDFGGGDYNNRLQYQWFLLSQEFKEYCATYSSMHQGISLFDTKWYSFITNHCSLQDIIQDELLFCEKVNSALSFLEKSREKKNVITKNYNLVGYILPASNLSQKDIGVYFAKTLHLYIEFLKYLPCNQKVKPAYTSCQNDILKMLDIH